MYQTGLLLLTGPLRSVQEMISQYLKYAAKSVNKCLYIKLEPEFSNPFSKSDPISSLRLSKVIPLVYTNASLVCKDLDVRVILSKSKTCENNLKTSFDVILTNSGDDDKNIAHYVNNQFDKDCINIVKLDNIQSTCITEDHDAYYNIYDTVCLGGTFDRLHNGHKVLLSEAALRARKKLIVGVTDGQMLKNKVLWELIQPVEKRICDVSSFLYDIDHSLNYEVVPITDPYGPTITNPDINCIVVSEETMLGGEKVNVERKKKGMSELSLHVVHLLENFSKNLGEDDKLSSSTSRMHLLGTPIHRSHISYDGTLPYCILLQGLPMCGKSCIANSFQTLGLPIICCNEIISLTIQGDSALKEKIIQKLKFDSNSVDNAIDYKTLVNSCLMNQESRKFVGSTVFDKVYSVIQGKLKEHQKSGTKVVVLKDSVLLPRMLKSKVHEVWTSMLPVTEFSKRLKQVYELSDKCVSNVIETMPSNKEMIDESNIIFCNHLHPSVTQKQVERAWSYVKESLCM